MSADVREWLRRLTAQRQELDRTRKQVGHLRREHQTKLGDVTERTTLAFGELAAAMLPELTPEALARAVRLCGYANLASGDRIAARETERLAAQTRLAAIEKDPAFTQRELLRAPRTGTLVRAVEELEDFRKPLAAVLAKAAHPRLERLLEIGYGTDDYHVPFWRLAYYADWKAGDEILEAFPEDQTFAAARHDILEARDALRTYDARLAELHEQIAAGERLEAEHAERQQALATVDERHLARAREDLARYLQDLEPAALGDRLASEPNLSTLAKRAYGLAAKRQYLESLKSSELDRLANEVQTSLRKVDRQIAKWRRPKHAHARFSDGDVQRRFGKPIKLGRRLDRYARTYDTVYVYDRWDRGRLVDDFLWWDLMTDGRIDGDFIPGVADFRRHHPGYAYHRDSGADEAAAAVAIAHADAGPLGGDALVDGS